MTTLPFAIERVPSESLFVPAMFRDEPYVLDVCRRVPELWMSRDTRLDAHGHFSSYYGLFVYREARYRNNPIIAALYALHELTHMAIFERPKPQHETFNQWSYRMITSEVEATLETECYIYYRLPELRSQTFGFDIWVDRFLGELKSRRFRFLCALYNRFVPNGQHNLPPWVRWNLRRARLEAIDRPRFGDYLEGQISNYGRRQNQAWTAIWGRPVGYGIHAKRPAFRVVEEHRARPGWMDHHPEWLAEVTDFDHPTRPIPFGHQADEFQIVYDQTIREFGNDVLTA